LRAFKDYDIANAGTAAWKNIDESVTPAKREPKDAVTPSFEALLTPPSTIKSETDSLDFGIDTDERKVRRSKRRKTNSSSDDPFGKF
jgi:hypothetical protein